MRSRILLVVGASLCAMAVVFGVVAGVQAAGTAAFLSGAAPADGVVTALDERRSDRDGSSQDRYTYRPVVVFEANGAEHTFTGRVGSDPPAYEVGERVAVLYDPADPREARLTGGFAYWFELIFGLAAVVLAVVGIALIASWSRTRARGRLAHTGERATGTVTRARTVSAVTFNGRPRTEATVTWRHPFAGEQTLTEKSWGVQRTEGDEVVVRYDADRPARAVLEPPTGPELGSAGSGVPEARV